MTGEKDGVRGESQDFFDYRFFECPAVSSGEVGQTGTVLIEEITNEGGMLLRSVIGDRPRCVTRSVNNPEVESGVGFQPDYLPVVQLLIVWHGNRGAGVGTQVKIGVGQIMAVVGIDIYRGHKALPQMFCRSEMVEMTMREQYLFNMPSLAHYHVVYHPCLCTGINEEPRF